jgi:hypothetical protein
MSVFSALFSKIIYNLSISYPSTFYSNDWRIFWISSISALRDKTASTSTLKFTHYFNTYLLFVVMPLQHFIYLLLTLKLHLCHLYLLFNLIFVKNLTILFNEQKLLIFLLNLFINLHV